MVGELELGCPPLQRGRLPGITAHSTTHMQSVVAWRGSPVLCSSQWRWHWEMTPGVAYRAQTRVSFHSIQWSVYQFGVSTMTLQRLSCLCMAIHIFGFVVEYNNYSLDTWSPCFADVGSWLKCGPFHICCAASDAIIQRRHVLDGSRVNLPAFEYRISIVRRNRRDSQWLYHVA